MRRAIASLGFALSCAVVTPALCAPDPSALPSYPASRTVDVAEVFHGVTVNDPYRWLEALDSADTRAWVDAQNRFSRPRLRERTAWSTLHKRIVELGDAWPEDDVPVVVGGRHFFQGLDASGMRPVLFVREGADGKAKLLFDPASLGEGATLNAFKPSPDGQRVALTIGKGGSDWGDIRVFDVANAKPLGEVLRGIRFAGSVHWTADAKGFLYRRNSLPEGQALEAAATGAAIYRHVAGTPQSSDVLVYAIPKSDSVDKSLDINVSDDRRRVFLYVERGPWLDFLGGSMRKVLALDIDARGLPSKSATPVALTRRLSAYRVIATMGTRLYVLTDLDAPRRRLVSFDVRSADPENWKTVIPQSEGVLESVHHVGGRFVAVYLENVHSVLRVFDKEGKSLGSVDLNDLGTVRGLRGDAGTNDFRFIFSSFLSPPVILRHDLGTGSTEVESRGKVTVDASRFETRQVWFASKDGTRVPMFVLHRRGLNRDGSHPTILYGYGASGDSSLPGFSEDIFAWLEMGGIYAVANVRGGGEFGKAWYEAAILERKQTTFDDFIAAAEYLIAEDYTSPQKLAISGASNGGLLVTAAMTQRPDLFAVVLADVPVTDALRRNRSGTGAVQTGQWGTTDDARQFKAMRAYSPLHNVTPQRCYPATLITTARNDDRLPPWHAYKFTAALQAAQSCDQPILLQVRDSGAHGTADFNEMFDAMTTAISFAAGQLGMDDTQSKRDAARSSQ